MKFIVAGHSAVTATEFAELALGTPLELWLGEDNETEEERAARLDAARDILADDPGLPDRVSRVAAEAIETYAPHLLNVHPLPLGSTHRAAGRRGAVAA
ncbi:hypothetical protein [Streptomyces sp. Ru87]|uniref:hypothetical protein n=1 Tax=Streptomyces sp. Ru87 TaxID=2044307 RepID=UPI000BF49EA2|nr:hypothetical protein [Streptomyces sp. Ru87]PGH49315.1 hypothetical protein CRI70_18420 [Streptomyces sp. Ru87]